MHGIVIIEIYSHNKQVNTLYTAVVSFSYILLKCAKTREPKDEPLCIAVYPYNIYMTLYP